MKILSWTIGRVSRSNILCKYLYLQVNLQVVLHTHFSIRQELTVPEGDVTEDRMAQKEFKKIYKAEIAEFIAHLRYFFKLNSD